MALRDSELASTVGSGSFELNAFDDYSELYTNDVLSVALQHDRKESRHKPTAREKNLELTLSERVHLRCSPRSYKIRWIRSRGAILVLLLNCLIANNAGPLSAIMAGLLGLFISDKTLIKVIINVIHGGSFLFYPFAGWIADVRFGRYKVIRTSLHLMWVGLIAITACVCVEVGSGANLKPLYYIIYPAALIAIQCGIAGFKANAIPFGMDHLMGSGEEMSAYVHWFVFTIMINVAVLSIPFSCFVDNPNTILLLQLLVQVICVSIALCLDFCLKSWFVMEPRNANPLKTIYRVLNYARKNKRAQFRSAFTYHLQEIPSRIEICKPQYGGPFSVENVEDVKTFLRMLSVLVPMSLIVLMGIIANSSIGLLSDHTPHTSDCLVRYLLGTRFSRFLSVVILPVYEFLLYPLLHKLIPTMLVRAGIGTFFFILSFLAQLLLDTLGHQTSNMTSTTGFNGTESTCIFNDNSTDLTISYYWLIIPGVLRTIGVLFNLIAVYEFVFAQAPHSMKGLFVGLKYGIEGVCRLLVILCQLPFVIGILDNLQAPQTCGLYYYLMNSVITIVVLVWYSGVAWKYKKRDRDSLEREYAFAEEYYDKYLPKRN